MVCCNYRCVGASSGRGPAKIGHFDVNETELPGRQRQENRDHRAEKRPVAPLFQSSECCRQESVFSTAYDLAHLCQYSITPLLQHSITPSFHPSALRFSSSRISRRRSLPTLDLGSMSLNSMYWGTLYAASLSRHHLIRSYPVNPFTSSFRTT